MNFIERFQLIKCQKHPDKPITNICLNEQCQEQHQFCQTCVKLHVEHSKQIIYMKQIDVLLKRNTNVNEISQDKFGLEAYNIYREFKKTIQNQLNQLEEELRIIINNLVNDSKINQYGYKFLQTINEFNKDDIEDLRKYLIKEQQDIQKNQVILKENQNQKKIIELKDYLQNQIPNIQKDILNQLDCVNRIFYTNSQRIDRLKKVWITDEGLSQPSIFDKNTIRVNQFQIRDKPLYLIGIYQPMLYKGSYNSSNYDSQSKSSLKLTYKLHLGNDLTKQIFKEHKILEHEKLTIVDGHLYYLEFKNPIKLLPHQTYSLSISTKEQKAFYTYQYSNNHIDHPLIKWQSENLTESDQFIKGQYEHLYSYPDIDQIPAIQVKL
ncbi:unnamed protein product [Paramecium pentaurelia]|uniref:Uncharacterized protein n=1 Tax=Paramecium pentaurelia TaxID=43138 RepID=A0A8S1XKG0_9CILI|nr:unnamed protein product [Paramecium pentaurelia]